MNVISSVYNLLKRRTYRPLVLLWDMSKTWISLPWIFFFFFLLAMAGQILS